MKLFRYVLCAAFLLLATSCHERTVAGRGNLVSLHIIDRNGFSETIGSKDRLSPYKKVDFLSTQPYQKVLRVFSRDEEGKSTSTLTIYHPSGHIAQYLEIVDGRAHGMFREWHPNGKLHIELSVLDGTADVGEAAQLTWLFDGTATVYDESGALLAAFTYEKGVLTQPALHYGPSGALIKREPYVNGLLEGVVEEFSEKGEVIGTTTYVHGLKEGPSFHYWAPRRVQEEEVYAHDLLQEGASFLQDGAPVCRIKNGCGMKALFDPIAGTVAQMQTYKNGKPEGLVQLFDDRGCLVRTYHQKEGMKEGEEIEYFPLGSKEEPPKPKLLLTWAEDALHGPVKTWYVTGVQQSGWEMHQNKKQGFSFSWYEDGSLMLSEEYDQDKLAKGSYFERGAKLPCSSVENGKGTATLHDPDGKGAKKVAYENGKPLLHHK